MTRIRYARVGDIRVTDWISIRPNLVVRATILSDRSFSVYDTESNLVYSGDAANIRRAKHLVRQFLVDSGLILQDEIRRRNTP